MHQSRCRLRHLQQAGTPSSHGPKNALSSRASRYTGQRRRKSSEWRVLRSAARLQPKHHSRALAQRQPRSLTAQMLPRAHPQRRRESHHRPRGLRMVCGCRAHPWIAESARRKSTILHTWCDVVGRRRSAQLKTKVSVNDGLKRLQCHVPKFHSTHHMITEGRTPACGAHTQGTSGSHLGQLSFEQRPERLTPQVLP